MAPRIGRSAKLITLLIRAQLVAHDINLTREQFILLMHVEERPKPQSSLALITERDKGSLTRLVQSLEKKEFIKRNDCQEDNRVNYVEITTKGIEVLNQTKPIVAALFAKIKKGINTEDWNVAIAVLDKITANANDELKKVDNSKY